ncbi:terminase TerL endonuclease subunit [uncultured Ruminococcus sp.]|uniref:terminase TerL endonuclease subunit n=1 Tax=uncultured Ruminococcus sp. TaxID=165186 RepID=UPI0025E3367A|nr:terminase TerL endonuclease subunit [uncultured Ruminococcus sp.]
MNRYIQEYIDIVRKGEYPVCKEQLLLCDFVEKVFETESVYVDEEQLEKYFELQKYWDFDLFPWEKFCFALHNCTYSAPGILRFSKLVILVGRGAGKNGYLSFEDFALLTPTNGIKYYNIDICATSEEQAKTSFFDIYNMLEENSSKMKKHFSWNKTQIENLKTHSVLRFRTSNSKTADGGRPGKVDFDEYHAYENYKLINVFKTGFGKKPMPRTTITTTNGYVRDGPLDDLLSDGLQVLNGEIPDNGTLYFICRLDNDEEVQDKNNWHKANPSLRYFPNLQMEMNSEFEDWKRDHLGNSDFMVKRMNRIQGSTEAPVTEWKNILATNQPIPDLKGKTCVFGIDYTKTTDFLSVGLLFDIDNKIYWITHSWVCEKSADLSRIKFPVQAAEEEGLLTIVKGVEIPPEYPVEWLKEKQKIYNIVGGGLDNYRFTLLKNPLQSIGFDCEKSGKNNLLLVRPSDLMKISPLISSDFANQRIVYGDNKLMRWYTNNTKVDVDKKGNMTYGKIEPKSRKTDGFMAFAAAYTQKDKIKQLSPVSAETASRILQVYSY